MFLKRQNMSIYSGGSYHSSPMIISLWPYVNSMWPLVTLLFDIFSAICLRCSPWLLLLFSFFLFFFLNKFLNFYASLLFVHSKGNWYSLHRRKMVKTHCIRLYYHKHCMNFYDFLLFIYYIIYLF